MNISEIFIKRPIMTILVMAALLIAGLYGYFSLPVNELPNVDFQPLSTARCRGQMRQRWRPGSNTVGAQFP
jgi:hypothetical protein